MRDTGEGGGARDALRSPEAPTPSTTTSGWLPHGRQRRSVGVWGSRADVGQTDARRGRKSAAASIDVASRKGPPRRFASRRVDRRGVF